MYYYQFVYENLLYDYKQYNQHEMREEIYNYDNELFDELVDNVTNETVLDTNNNGGKS